MSDIEKIFYVNLDITDTISYPAIDFTERDTLNKIIFNVSNNGEPIENLSLYNYKVFVKRPDGVLVCKIPEIVNNRLHYTLGTTEIAVAGICKCSLEIYEGLNKITTKPFSFTVTKSLNDTSVTESSETQLHIQYDYRDLANQPDIPTATSDLENDSGFITTSDSRLSDSRTPTAHTHVIENVDELQEAIDSKADISTVNSIDSRLSVVESNIATEDDYVTVTAVSNVYTCDLSLNKDFCIEVSNTTAKTIRFSNIPSGLSCPGIKIKFTAVASVTYPSGTTWIHSFTPVTGKTYYLLFATNNGGTSWKVSSMEG